MSIFGRIKDAILGHAHAATPASAPALAAHPTATVAAVPAAAPAPSPAAPIDMGPVLDDLAAKAGQPLHWRTSIVDLMKLMGMDSSLATRHELADELGYTADKSDSAAMNIWLHQKVMARLEGEGVKTS